MTYTNIKNMAVDQNPRTIGDLLRSRALTQEHDPFLIMPETGEKMTFWQTLEQVKIISGGLFSQGLKAGDRVALILQNGKESAIALLAVMYAGGVAVPLNPRLTDGEISRAIEQSASRFVICSNRQNHGALLCSIGFSKRAEGTQCGMEIEFFSSMVSDSNSTQLDSEVTGRSPALILFTSGTTGRPKGVVLCHSNLLANASFVRQAHQLSNSDIALCILPLFHINGLVVTLLAPLLSGLPVVLPQRFHADQFWKLVAEYGVTWFSAVPTILSILLSQSKPERESFKSLRFARSASAPLPVAVLEEFEKVFSVPVIETYGISEAACQVTANPLPPLQRKQGSAGKPVGNRLMVVGEQGDELAHGQVGEVVLRGENVFNGYLANPEADLEALKCGWFHTGDLGYLDQDGYLFLTGRRKELINRAGEKISPREVEEVIHRLPQVETVGVVGVPNRLYGEEVTAFVALRPGKELGSENIKQFCKQHLAGFKVPREVFFIQEFPKGPSGKIQRRLLVDLYHEITGCENNERQAQ